MVKGRSRIYWYFLYPLVAIIFGIVCVFFVFSARGYNFKFEDSRLRIEKTGMIIVNSHPNGAEIYLDGKKLDKKALPFFSTKIDNLLPGKYVVTVKKEDHQTWEKEVEVFPEAVTWADYVLLFPQEITLNEMKFSDQEVTAVLRKKSNYSLIKSLNKEQTDLSIINNTNGEINTLGLAPLFFENNLMNIDLIDWSENRRYVLVRAESPQGAGYYIIDNSSKSLIDVNKIFKINFDSLAFNENDSNTLLGIKEGGLYVVTLSSSTISTTVDLGVVSAIAQGDRLYYIKGSTNGRVLIQSGINGNNKITVTSAVPKGSDFIIKVLGEKITLYSKSEKTLDILQRVNSRYQLVSLGANVEEFEWSPSSERIFFRNNDLIEVIDFKKEKEWKISAEDFKQLSWYDNDHFLGMKGEQVTVMDFDGTNRIFLGTAREDLPILFSPVNKNIIFVKNSAKTPISFFKANF